MTTAAIIRNLSLSAIVILVVLPIRVNAVNILDNLGLGAGTPAAAAYSVRRLSSSYAGYAITVRRSSDNTTQDISFTAGGDLKSVGFTDICRSRKWLYHQVV